MLVIVVIVIITVVLLISMDRVSGRQTTDLPQPESGRRSIPEQVFTSSVSTPPATEALTPESALVPAYENLQY
jgi:hypothetical protein